MQSVSTQTKTHLAVVQRHGVISFLLTPGQAGDSPQMIGVLERIRAMRPGGRRARTRPDRVLADKPSASPRPDTSPSSTTGVDDVRNRR
jgi:Transposase DDE domain